MGPLFASGATDRCNPDGGDAMAIYMFDEEEDVMYVLLAQLDPDIERTIELTEGLIVDLDRDEQVVGVEIHHPADGDVDLGPLKELYGLELKLPFSFAVERRISAAI